MHQKISSKSNRMEGQNKTGTVSAKLVENSNCSGASLKTEFLQPDIDLNEVCLYPGGKETFGRITKLRHGAQIDFEQPNGQGKRTFYFALEVEPPSLCPSGEPGVSENLQAPLPPKNDSSSKGPKRKLPAHAEKSNGKKEKNDDDILVDKANNLLENWIQFLTEGPNVKPFLEKEREDWFKLIEDELGCCICHNLCTNPVLTNCQHIACEHCLTNWLTISDACPGCTRAPVGYTPARCLVNFFAQVKKRFTPATTAPKK